MQVSASTVSPAPALASSSLVAQVKRQAAILADDSGATTDQKVDAYIAISKAIAQSAASAGGWFQESTQADRDAVNAVMDTASVANQVRQAADSLNARAMRADRRGNVMADQIQYLNSLSDQQQKMIFAGAASLEQTDTIDGWKSFLQRNADSRDQQIATEQSAVNVTLSKDAKAALSSASGDQALGAATPFKNQDRFAALIERVSNVSGSYSENAPDMSGASPFTDVSSWRTSMLAGILLAQRADKSKAERSYEAGSVASKQV